MPLIAHTRLPTYQRLQQEGLQVLEPERAQHQDIRELHIGLLNMMPDAALAATERQFFRLVAESNQVAQFHMHPFTLAELDRGADAAAHVEQYYETFAQLKADGLDALIITGANVVGPELSNQPFWEPLIDVMDWAAENVTSILCSCLATHAIMEFRYGQKRRPMRAKRWGVFGHDVVDRTHPLVNDVNTRFDVPHSRFNDINQQQFEDAGLRVLVNSEVAGVHLAVSQDGFRVVMFQGHPEYDTISLLKEYKREVRRYQRGERAEYPPLPVNYFNPHQCALLAEYRGRLDQALGGGSTLPEFPEALLTPDLNNTWHDTAEAVVNNWVGKIYLLTHSDRHKPFMDGVDPNQPLA